MNQVQFLIKSVTSNSTKYGAPIAKSSHRRCSVKKKRCSEKFCKFDRKTLVLQSLFNKIAGLKAFLRTLTLKKIYEWLFLHRKYFSMIFTRSVAQLFLKRFSTYLLRSSLCSHKKQQTFLCLRFLPIPVVVIRSLTGNRL